MGFNVRISMIKMTIIEFMFAGMNQLLWYYADLEKQACLDDQRANNTASMTAIPGRKSSKVCWKISGNRKQIFHLFYCRCRMRETIR